MVDYAVTPSRAALLNIDMQNCFVEAAQDGRAALDRINRFAAVCREAGILVIHTAHVLNADGSDMGLLGDLVPMIKGGSLSRDSRSAALHPDLVVDSGDVLLEKPRFGAFHRTNLEEILQTRGIDTLFITGISSDVCCDMSAREAQARDIKVLFLSDSTAVAGPNPDAVQSQTLRYIAALIGQVLSTEEAIAKIARGTTGP